MSFLVVNKILCKCTRIISTHTYQLAYFPVRSALTNNSRALCSKAKHEVNAKFIDDNPKIPPKQRLKQLIAVYGPTAVVLHIGLSLSFLGLTYLTVQYGLDVPSLMEKYNFMSESYIRVIANGGTFGLAYALYKAMMPFRVLVTLFLTPIVARRLKAFGLLKRKF